MAGIGFVLRKLYRQNNLAGPGMACLHAAFAATGPWLLTVLALGIISAVGYTFTTQKVLLDFRVILIYNFSFSLVFAGPVFMIVTRYLADCMYRRDMRYAPGTLVVAMLLLWGTEIIPVGAFYFLYAKLSFPMALSAVLNFLLISFIWLVCVFISTLKDYQTITRSFLLGMTLATSASLLLGKAYGALGFLNGWSLGLCLILAMIVARILVEYPYPLSWPKGFFSYFKKYWMIALGGLIYPMAIWVDKWIMWFAPEAITMPNKLPVYPHYDSAMFLACLTTVPAMALFLFNAETHLFERYVRFYRDIEGKATFARIERNHKELKRSIFGGAGYFLLLQGTIAMLAMAMAPWIIQISHGNYLQVGMLRYGLAGAFFQVLTLFLLVILSYFDYRKGSFLVQFSLLATNALFTWATLFVGFSYYGYGYFLSSFVTFLVALLVTARYTSALPYHTFITANASIRQA